MTASAGARAPDQPWAILAAMTATAAAGLLYVQSLFILPLERDLGLGRADLGLVASISLITFTAGAMLFPAFLVRLGRGGAIVLAFALMAGGHLLFAVLPGPWMLRLGYGACFGFGSGLGYGLALSVAAGLSDRRRALGIGLALGAFALSGIVLPFLLGSWIATVPVTSAFTAIGCAVLAAGLLCLALSRCDTPGAPSEAAAAVVVPPPDRAFLLLTAIFFLICFIGLAVISHIAAIAVSLEQPGLAASAMTLGYLPGSLFGSLLADRYGERLSLTALCLLALGGVLALMSGLPALILTGAVMSGAALGGSGSVLPMLIGKRYGAELIPVFYGRMLLAYGLGGLIAPGVAGLIFAKAQSYTPFLALCVILAGLALVLAAVLRRSLAPPDITP